MIDLHIFGVSGSPVVLIGKKGYLFYATQPNMRLIERAYPFAHEHLVAWKNLLESRTKWCQERGMDYTFILVPTKASIYPEFLPDGYNKSANPTRTDQLIDFLRQTHSPVKVLNLADALRKGKGPSTLFLRTDTHWNQLGSYYGYKAVIEAISKRYPTLGAPLPLTRFSVLPYHFVKGDLARMQGLLGILTEENIAVIPAYSVKFTRTVYPQCYPNWLGLEESKPFFCKLDNHKLPTAVIFRDSFAGPWAKSMLPNHFSKLAFYWQPEFSQAVLLNEKPKIVMQELLETCLYEEIPKS